jgi:hypothetical protein
VRKRGGLEVNNRVNLEVGKEKYALKVMAKKRIKETLSK